MSSDESFFEKNAGKIGAAGLALNALQNQKIQKNQKVLGRIQAESARLQKERNDLLKKQIEEEEKRKEKQYQLLKLAPQLKQFLQKLSDDKAREGKEIGLLIELCTQLHQYLHENDKYVNDVKFHEFIMEINPIIENLKEKHQQEVEDYNKMIRELDLAIEVVRPLLNIIDLLENIDGDYIYQDDVNTTKILEKCRIIRKEFDKINSLIQKLEVYIEFDAEAQLTKIQYLNKDVIQNIVSLPTQDAIDIRQKLVALPDKDWITKKTSEVEKYVSDIRKASKIMSEIKEPNPEYIFQQLTKDIQELSTPIRKKVTIDIQDELYRLQKEIDNFKNSKRPENLEALHNSWGSNFYSYDLIKKYDEQYAKAKKKKKLNYSVALSILLLLINLISILVLTLGPLPIIMINIVLLQVGMIVIATREPNTDKLSDLLSDIKKQNQYIEQFLKKTRKNI